MPPYNYQMGWLVWTGDILVSQGSPKKIKNPRKFALVINSQFHDYWLSKVIMDGGSNINILTQRLSVQANANKNAFQRSC
jgi:hypothetical protein